jgi:class III cytochrome C family protein
MKLKLIILSLYLVAAATPAVLSAAQSAQERDCEAQKTKCDDIAAQVRKLDLKGARGTVCFRHKPHEAFLNPDTEFVHKAGAGSECAACHHKRSAVTGAPILAKCGSCHRSEGNPANPRNTEGDEVWSERAFHELCIGCHRASNEKAISKCKAPIACSECHGSVTGG